jgi:hypothetical protein
MYSIKSCIRQKQCPKWYLLLSNNNPTFLEQCTNGGIFEENGGTSVRPLKKPTVPSVLAQPPVHGLDLSIYVIKSPIQLVRQSLQGIKEKVAKLLITILPTFLLGGNSAAKCGCLLALCCMVNADICPKDRLLDDKCLSPADGGGGGGGGGQRSTTQTHFSSFPVSASCQAGLSASSSRGYSNWPFAQNRQELYCSTDWI